jgi:hypothetical protein
LMPIGYARDLSSPPNGRPPISPPVTSRTIDTCARSMPSRSPISAPCAARPRNLGLRADTYSANDR